MGHGNHLANTRRVIVIRKMVKLESAAPTVTPHGEVQRESMGLLRGLGLPEVPFNLQLGSHPWLLPPRWETFSNL